jgi:hypothetical protein
MMKKLLIMCCTLVVSFSTYADGKYGCVMSAAGGLYWQNKSWQLKNFEKENILISVQGNGSILKYRGSSDDSDFEYACTFSTKNKYLTCVDSLGSLILFDEVGLKGGVAQLLGSVERSTEDKDSLSVAEFTCQKF